MGRKRKLAIIGHFAEGVELLDGQTIKTKVLYEELVKTEVFDVKTVDTYNRRKNPFKLICQTIKALASARDIIVLVSKNGMRVYYPILYVVNRLFGTRVYQSVIGGNLADYVDHYPKFRKYLNAFRANWVETEALRSKLEERQITNARVIPNFKRLSVAGEDTLTKTTQAPFRFCTFSRVMKEKGIEDAIAAVETINQEAGSCLCTLDIYGKVDEGYAQRFSRIISEAGEAVQYRGVVPYDKSVETIKAYYALLFPTYWYGEGFAGTIVDAFSSGLPVIATDWNCNAEIVENGVTGLLYPSREHKDLEAAIRWCIGNPDSVWEMKKNCVRVAQSYQPDRFIKQIMDEIQG